MKKSLLISALSASMAVTLVGCGNAEDKYAKLANLGDYKTIEVEVEKYNYTEEELEKLATQEVESYIEQYDMYEYSPIKDAEKVKKGDVVNIDFCGKKDGVAFDGGTSEGYHLEIGSGSFIPGFEDGLVGVKVGECVDLDLTFPEEYQSEELAGQDVVFTVSVNSIDEKIAPEYDADLFTSMGSDGVTNFDEYVDSLRETVDDYVESQNIDAVNNAILDKLYEMCNVDESKVPEELVKEKISEIDSDYSAYAEYYGIEKEQLVSYMGAEEGETYDQVVAKNAKEEAIHDLIYIAISTAENIDLSDESLDAFAEEHYEELGFESAEALKTSREGNYFKSYVRKEKVLEVLRQYTTVKETGTVSALEEYLY